MENQSQILNSLVQYISQLVSLNRRLNKKKITPQIAKLAFVQLDSKRKGYLDLVNVYQLAGNNVTEEELFHLFKWLDISKTGDISHDDFQYALVSGQTQEKQDNKQRNPLKTVKQIVVIFLQNLQYKNGLRKKLQLTENNLRNIFRSICQSHRKNNLQIEDLSYVMSFAKNWDSHCENELNELFKQSKIISQKVFVESLVQLNQSLQKRQSKNEPNHTQKSGNIIKSFVPAQLNQSQLLDQINKEYLQSRSLNHTQATFRPSPKKHQTPQFHRNNFMESKNQNNSYKSSSNCNQQQIGSQSNQQNSESSQIESMLNNIEKKRQQLRKGSMQRKKLIEQALERKKTYFSNGPLFSNEPQCKKFMPQSPSYNSYSKSSNYNFNQTQFTNNNPINFDLQRKFTKYRDQRNQAIQNRFTPNKSYLQKNSEQKNPRQIIAFSNIQRQKYTPQIYKQYEKKYSQNSKTNGFERNYNLEKNDNQTMNIDLNNYKTMNQTDSFERNVPLTPKFSQTLQQNFYSNDRRSMSSSKKVDRIDEIRQKINNLPDMKFYQKAKQLRNPDQAQINHIIEKYRKNTNNNKKQNNDFYNRAQYQNRRYPNQVQSNVLNNYLRTKDQNFKSYSKNQILRKSLNKNNQTPKKSIINENDYYQIQKGRLNGSISSVYKNNSTNNIQKQNLLRKAEEQAARKIQEIQRKAKLKVLQRKSAIGLKWGK